MSDILVLKNVRLELEQQIWKCSFCKMRSLSSLVFGFSLFGANVGTQRPMVELLEIVAIVLKCFGLNVRLDNRDILAKPDRRGGEAGRSG